MKERREYKRIAIKVPVNWKSERHWKSKRSDAFFFHTHNITSKGLFLKTNLRPKKGSRLSLELKVRKVKKPITLGGKVIWIARKTEQPYHYPGLGIEFENIPKKDHRRLYAFLRDKSGNFQDAIKLKNMYMQLKDMASNLVDLEERHSSAIHFKKILDNAISEIDDVAHILDREISEIKKM